MRKMSAYQALRYEHPRLTHRQILKLLSQSKERQKRQRLLHKRLRKRKRKGR